jgi:hypothetical protein
MRVTQGVTSKKALHDVQWRFQSIGSQSHPKKRSTPNVSPEKSNILGSKEKEGGSESRVMWASNIVPSFESSTNDDGTREGKNL